MNDLVWTKKDKTWTGRSGKFLAFVSGPSGYLNRYRWVVGSGELNGMSGSTSSAAASKKEAQKEIYRLRALDAYVEHGCGSLQTTPGKP